MLRVRSPALAAVLLALAALARAGAEPSFEGKTLGQWMALLKEVPKDPARTSSDWRKAPYAVGKIGVPALPSLIEAMGDADAGVRLRVIRPIVVMGPTASDAAPALATRLGDPDAQVRQWSAVALGQIGGPAAGAVPKPAAAFSGSTASVEPMKAAAADANTGVQRAVRLALQRLQPDKP